MLSSFQRFRSVHIGTCTAAPVRTFVQSTPLLGLEEFFDQKKVGELVVTGRGWTVPDLRRKVGSFIHIFLSIS
jgi:hypothetical protein